MTDADMTPDITKQPTPADELLALCLVTGEHGHAIQEAQKALTVFKRKGTAAVLAAAKRFDSLAAFIQADDNAQAAAIGQYRTLYPEGKATARKGMAKACICSTYLTGCAQIRGAAAVLGWEAVLTATSIGNLYSQKTRKEKATEGTAEDAKPDVMPDAPKANANPPSPVQAKVQEIAEAMAGLPEDVALQLCTDVLASIIEWQLEQAQDAA